MIDYHIDNYIYASLMSLTDKIFKIINRSILRINFTVVLHIILVVCVRRHYRHKPYTVKAHILYVVKLLCDTVQIACSVTVRIIERIDENLVIISIVIVNDIQLLFILISPAVTARKSRHTQDSHQHKTQKPAKQAMLKYAIFLHINLFLQNISDFLFRTKKLRH